MTTFYLLISFNSFMAVALICSYIEIMIYKKHLKEGLKHGKQNENEKEKE